MKKTFLSFTLLLALFTMFMAMAPPAEAQAPQMTVVQIGQKGAAATLFGGAITTTVSLANATVIDMNNYTGGTLELVLTTGTESWDIDVYSHYASTGTFVKHYYLVDSTWTAFPTISTTAATAANQGIAYRFDNLRAKYIKIVPTIKTGYNGVTPSMTVIWTPSK